MDVRIPSEVWMSIFHFPVAGGGVTFRRVLPTLPKVVSDFVIGSEALCNHESLAGKGGQDIRTCEAVHINFIFLQVAFLLSCPPTSLTLPMQ